MKSMTTAAITYVVALELLFKMMGWVLLCCENFRSYGLRSKMAKSSKWHPILEAGFPYSFKTSRSQRATDPLSDTI